MERKIEISTRTIGFLIFLVLGVLFLFRVSSVVIAIFVAFLFSSALSPIVRFVERRRIPRAVSIPLVFFLILSTLFLGGALIIPPLVFQLIKFFERLPFLVSSTIPLADIDLNTFSSQFTMVGQNLFKVTKGFFSDIFSFISIFVLTFYMLYERKNIEEVMSLYLGRERAIRFSGYLIKVERALGAWARGQFVLGLIIGVSTYIGLRILGIEYALPLAVISGLLEIVPVIGPIISAIPAIVVAFSVSFNLAILTALLYLIIQQSENHFIVPFVMRKAIGLSPLITIVAIMVGGNLAGVAGMLLAVPVVVISHTVFKELTS